VPPRSDTSTGSAQFGSAIYNAGEAPHAARLPQRQSPVRSTVVSTAPRGGDQWHQDGKIDARRRSRPGRRPHAVLLVQGFPDSELYVFVAPRISVHDLQGPTSPPDWDLVPCFTQGTNEQYRTLLFRTLDQKWMNKM
jgi:hypothetical protein